MARATTTSDIFNAIAEIKRREMIELLADGRERTVSELVAATEQSQPSVSKHLKVLLAVGVVTVEPAGKERLYKLNAEALRPVHDWVKPMEKFWSRQLTNIKQRAEELAAKQSKKN